MWVGLRLFCTEITEIHEIAEIFRARGPDCVPLLCAPLRGLVPRLRTVRHIPRRRRVISAIS